MKENTMSILQVHDVEPRVFKAMLHFIYNDSLPEIDEDGEVGMAQHLLVAADQYGLQRLKVMCEAMLLKHVDASAVATTLTLAEQHGCEGLKEGCFRFMRTPGVMKAVMASEGFQHLRTSCPFLIEEMLAKLIAP
jgi:speckle-type POZ protein